MAGSSGGTGPLNKIIKKITTIQKSNKEKAVNIFKKIDEDVVGSYIQGYQFDHEEGALISHGSVTMESGHKGFNTVDATFYILARDETAEKVARITGSTNKLTAACNAVAKVYLVEFCKNLNSWIICYEKFDALLSEHTIGMFPRFYDGNEVSAYWCFQIREIIDALYQMCLRSVSHGSMSSSESYAFCLDEDGVPGEIKLIGMGKDNPKKYYDDLVDFVDLLGQYKHLNVSSNPSWQGFYYLANSSVIREEDNNNASQKRDTNKYLWAGKVSGHPLLILDPVKKVKCYMEIYVKMDQMTTTDKIGLANALYCLYPEYVDDKKELVDLVKSNHICHVVYSRKADVYAHHTVYTSIILFIRNLIKHGKDEFQKVSQGSPWQQLFCHTVEQVFPGFMSAAYTVVESGRSTWSQWHHLAFQRRGNLPFGLSYEQRR